MNDIAIYGAGGLGREVACLLRNMFTTSGEQWNLIGFFDDGKEKGTMICGKPVLGGLDELNTWPTSLSVALCFGSPGTLRTVHSRINNPMIGFPNIIMSDFRISDKETFTIGQGNIITGNCVATCNVSIGNFNLLNGSVTLAHDVNLGDFNVLMPGVRVSGEVIIGDGNELGAGAFVKQCLRIGCGVTIGPMSALLTKPKDNSLYIGNPARIFKF